MQQGDTAEVAKLRVVCEGAGGSVYARRVVPLLRTNLLTVTDIQNRGPESTGEGDAAASRSRKAKAMCRLLAAGLTQVEAGLLLLHLEMLNDRQDVSIIASCVVPQCSDITIWCQPGLPCNFRMCMIRDILTLVAVANLCAGKQRACHICGIICRHLQLLRDERADIPDRRCARKHPLSDAACFSRENGLPLQGV